ncbi:MAG: aldehyde dehydrogenase family protein, partial [Actinomycetota bacterium]
MTELERKQDRAPVPAGWDYAPAPEARDLVELRERYGHFVGGEWLEPRETYATIDPSSEEPLAEVGQATSEEVDLAVGAARDAFENGWSAISPAERAKYLFRIARILQERSREFAVLESLNGGKPIRESRDVDLPLSAAHFFYYAGWADKLEYA